MLIRLIQGRFDRTALTAQWQPAGTIIEVDDDEAATLIEAGEAVPHIELEAVEYR